MMYHLLVPSECSREILKLEDEDETFRVDEYTSRGDTKKTLFRVYSTEDTYLFLKLKYGNENVWLR